MKLIRWAPRGHNHPVMTPVTDDTQDLMNWFFDWPRSMSVSSRAAMPRVDMEETEHEIVVTADVPGMDPENIQVEVQDGIFTLSAEQSEKTEDDMKDKKQYHLRERHTKFYRSFSLPTAVESDKISAKYMKNGTLVVTLPKTPESQAKKVKIDLEK